MTTSTSDPRGRSITLGACECDGADLGEMLRRLVDWSFVVELANGDAIDSALITMVYQIDESQYVDLLVWDETIGDHTFDRTIRVDDITALWMT